mgnify:CR=1 FL=1
MPGKWQQVYDVMGSGTRQTLCYQLETMNMDEQAASVPELIMPGKEGLSLRQLVLRGIAGALAFHLSCNLLFWVFSFGTSLTEVLTFALAEVLGPVILGAFVGFLCARCGIRQSFWVAFMGMILANVIAFLASEYLGVPMSTGGALRNGVVYLVTVLVAGFAVSLLLIGLIVAVRWIAKR